MKHLPLLLFFILMGCGHLQYLENIEYPNFAILAPKNNSPATVYFPEVMPVSKPYIKGPLLTARFTKDQIKNWTAHLGEEAANNTFHGAIVVNQMTGSYAASSESAYQEPYMLVTYMGIWYAMEEYFPTNILKSVKYFNHSTRGKLHVATAHFDLGGKMVDLEGNREDFEWFQSWQTWYFSGYTHENWKRSPHAFIDNYRVDSSNPEQLIFYNHHNQITISGITYNNVIAVTNKRIEPLGHIVMVDLKNGPQTLYFIENKIVFKNEFGEDGLGRISSQDIYIVNQSEVLVGSADYEYYRFEDLPEDLIVYPAKAKI